MRENASLATASVHAHDTHPDTNEYRHYVAHRDPVTQDRPQQDLLDSYRKLRQRDVQMHPCRPTPACRLSLFHHGDFFGEFRQKPVVLGCS